ncbi:glycogenin-1 isoform X2 [Hyalella azteca]|uniref:glycogenin glucosyltransferase n=1 Tax=Hyalella azteca TaxID=294128 RepID=A0A979FG61_HYAAZ|nr:glycogenin-1 isoform X2 [Hyalella azteca]
MTEAYVTLATTDGYGVGALVLGHSLLSHGTTRQLCILVTPGVSEQVRSALSQVYHNVVLVDVMDSGDSAHLALLERPELGITFTKLHCWTLTQYTKCVFLDADTLALQNTDELFTQPELSAACDVGWPDCFNSGMFVFVPSQETYEQLLDFAKTKGSFDGGDQGLLNSFFPNWHRLSFVYNMVATACYTYLPAFKEFGRNVKLVHFLGSTKPWHGESAAQPGSAYGSFVGAWWTIYRELVRPSMPQSEAKFDPTDAPPQQQEQFPAQRSTSGGHLELVEHFSKLSTNENLVEGRQRWEAGRPEYMGRDSFDNIMAYIQSRINK